MKIPKFLDIIYGAFQRWQLISEWFQPTKVVACLAVNVELHETKELFALFLALTPTKKS